ncbi:MAG: transcriptional regulator [Alphaproteobacteria bacterium]|nr:transcriptional regulator [Alphaproteobacteria bacterium]
MPDPKFQKIKLLKIWEILNRKTDEQHPITTQELIAELNILGITADRRTIYTDIDSLQEFGYEIQNKRRNHDMVYWLPKRQFDLPEIKIIMDCIYSSKFVTASKTEGLIDKLADLGGSGRGDLLKRNAIHFNAVKHSNESIYEIVDVLERAIESKKKVSFNYFLLNQSGERVYKHNNKLYAEEPLAMVCNDGNYYLICYHSEEEYENHIKTFRVDRIDNISLLEEEISKEGKTALRKAKQYSLQAFKMYGGPLRRVTLRFDESLIGVIYNKFGEKTVIKKSGDKFTASVQVQISPTFWGWIMQFPTTMKIKSPEDLKERYREWVMSAIDENTAK